VTDLPPASPSNPDPRPSLWTGTVEDPLTFPAGTSISARPVIVGDSNAKIVPDGIVNWDFFDGAILGVFAGVGTGVLKEHGSAVMVAPGLAITATHVIGDILPELGPADTPIACLGVRPQGLDIWGVSKVSTASDDLSFLSLVLQSSLTPDWYFSSLPITTRCPRQGEKLTIVGFRMPDIEEADASFSAAGGLYCSTGTVVAAYSPVRHPTLMPFPAIEIACGSLGGMSGGAVLDQAGMLMGVISRGYATDDGEGPTYAAWIINALNRTLEIPWPPGLYEPSVHVLDLPEQLMHIEGRDAVTIVDENTHTYRVWFDGPQPSS
jgi:hypothetical protein